MTGMLLALLLQMPTTTPAASEPEQFAAVREIVLAHEAFPAARAETLATAVLQASSEYGLSPYLVLAVIRTESSFRPRAVSSVGAAGLMQIRPFVGEWLAEKLQVAWSGDTPLFDPVLNVRLGTFYLADLLDRFGDINIALSAYNWGPTRVANVLADADGLPEKMKVYQRRVWEDYAAVRRLRQRAVAALQDGPNT